MSDWGYSPLSPTLLHLAPFIKITWDLNCHAEGVLWNRYSLHIIVYKYTLRCDGNIVWQIVSMWQQQHFLSHKVNIWGPTLSQRKQMITSAQNMLNLLTIYIYQYSSYYSLLHLVMYLRVKQNQSNQQHIVNYQVNSEDCPKTAHNTRNTPLVSKRRQL